jgi:hypothetical protein
MIRAIDGDIKYVGLRYQSIAQHAEIAIPSSFSNLNSRVLGVRVAFQGNFRILKTRYYWHAIDFPAVCIEL